MLAEAGYRYDSSIRSLFRAFAREPWRRFIHRHVGPGGSLWEVPVSSAEIMGLHVPVAGGDHFRRFPRRLISRAIDEWDRQIESPFVMYFHTWELDPEQPRISSASLPSTIRQYRNLHRSEPMIREYLRRYAFHGVADHLGLRDEAAPAPPSATVAPIRVSAEPSIPSGKTSVSIVVPCYNEELALQYLSNTLHEVTAVLEPTHEIECTSLNYGSQDRTLEANNRSVCLGGSEVTSSCIASTTGASPLRDLSAPGRRARTSCAP